MEHKVINDALREIILDTRGRGDYIDVDKYVDKIHELYMNHPLTKKGEPVMVDCDEKLCNDFCYKCEGTGKRPATWGDKLKEGE